MSRTVLLSALEPRIRRAVDIENDDHVTSSEILSLINAHYPEYWDLLIEAGPPNLLASTTTFSTVAGQESYAIGTIVSAGNFYKMTGLYLVHSDGTRLPLRQFQDAQAQAWQPVTTGGDTIQLNYIICCPVLTTMTGSESVEGYNGWEEFLVQRIAMEIKKKRQEDYKPFQESANRIEQRIRKMANPDKWEPSSIIRRKNSPVSSWHMNASGPNAYMLRGTNIELVTFRNYF